MRHLLPYFTLLLSLTSMGQNLTAYFDYKVFIVPDQGLLLETYVDVSGSSVNYLPVTDSTFQAETEIQIIITENGKVKDFTKETVLSPLAQKGYSPDFMSLNRFLLPKGKYDLELVMKDLNSETPAVSSSRSIDLTMDMNTCSFSDIELIAGHRKAEPTSKMAKSGMEFIPLMSNFFGDGFNELLFYVELYHVENELKEDTPFLLRYALEDANHELPAQGTETFIRKKSAEVITVMGRIDLAQVPTGLYNLVVEAKDRDENILAFRKLRIVRESHLVVKTYTSEQIDLTFIGAVNDKDSLIEYIDCLRPIAGDREKSVIDYQAEGFTLLQCKSFFYSFWESRSISDPGAAWQAYKEEVNTAEQKFGTSNKRGYMTDMGRVFLQYGAPNSVADRSNDTESYPYQIWHYYKADKFSDKRFVFYDPELLQREYTLLHSDVPGEVRNPRWDMVINGRNNAQWNVDQNSAGGRSSDQMQQLYDTPR